MRKKKKKKFQKNSKIFLDELFKESESTYEDVLLNEISEGNLLVDKQTPYDFAVSIKKRCFVKSIVNQNTVYIYSDMTGSFMPYTKNQFGIFLFGHFKNHENQRQFKSHFTAEIFHFLLNDPNLQIESKDFNQAPESYLNIKNGVFDVKKWKLKPHSPAYLFDYTLQIEFNDKDKRPKKFLKALKQCFQNKDDRKLCLEILAYILSNNSSAKSVWFFVGNANTGKSMLLKLITHIIGERFVASIPLDHLDGKFDLSSAVHCRANIVAEVSNLKLKEVKTLKMITGGDQVAVERKFSDSYYSVLNLKFLLAGNHLPQLEKTVAEDDGIKSRFKFLGFYNSLDESKRISNYDKILYEEEGNAIFYCLMRSLKNFYDRGCTFRKSLNSQELSQKFFKSMKNPDELFIENFCIQSTNGEISIADLYNAYEQFCDENHFTASNKKDFINYILNLPSRPQRKKSRVNGNKNPVHVIRGLELKFAF